MIITNEEDQLRHERHLQDTFARRTARLASIRTKLYQGFEPSQKEALIELSQLGAGERPLFACLQSLNSYAIITNQRLIWRASAIALNSLTWSEIVSIGKGTSEQRERAKALESRDLKEEERLTWDCIEVTDTTSNVHEVEFENGKVLEWIHWCLTALHGTYHRQQKGKKDPDAYVAHKYSSRHRSQVLQSRICGCFYCLHIFAPGDIVEWIDRDDTGLGTTAVCPRCNIDSVIGSESGYPITTQFLERMKRFWF